MGLACRQHAGLPRNPVPARALSLLQQLNRSAGREWPTIDPKGAVAQTAPLPARWLAAALEQRAPYRSLIFPSRSRGAATSTAHVDR